MHHELEKFLSIVEHGSFTEAAKQTYVSQPALTAAIKSLESRYNVKLFFRGTKPLKLTEAGSIVHASAARLRMETDQLLFQIKNLRNGQKIPRSIGAIDSIAMRILEQDIQADSLEVHVDNSARLIEAVRLNRVDLAFIATPLTQPAGSLDITDLTTEAFRMVSHPQQRAKVRQDLTAYGLIESFVTYNPESTTFQRIATTLKSQRINFHVSFASTSPELIRQSVIRQKGTALLPYSFVKDDIACGRLRTIEEVAFRRPISLVTAKDIVLPEAHRSLVQAITEVI